MISLIEEPGAIVFAQNPVVYQAKATNDFGLPFSAKGMSQSIFLSETYNVSDGTKIIVNLTEGGATYSLTFDFVAVPANDHQMPTYTINTGIIQDVFEGYYAKLAVRLGQSHLLSPFLAVSFSPASGYSNHAITFHAIDVGTTFSLSVENFLNATVGLIVVAVADTTPVNYGVIYEVFTEGVYNSGIFKSTFLGGGTVNASGIFRTNIQNILTRFSESIKVSPPNCTILLAHKAANLRRFYVRFAEKQGSPTVQSFWSIGAVRKLVRGGIANNIFQRGNFLASRTWETSLLNTLPDARTVAANSPEFLAWYNYTGGAQSLKVEWRMWNNEDGTMSTGINTNFSLLAEASETLMIPALFFHINKAQTAAVEVRLLTQTGSPVSGWQRYEIDRRFREDERYLMFLNHFGVFETIRMTGDLTQTADLTRRESVRFVGDVMEVFEAEKHWQRGFTYRTGHLSKAECLALDSLVASRFVFEVSLTEGYIPLRILDTKFTLDDGKQDLWSLELKAAPVMDYGAPSSDLWVRW